jgi:hypothetical protein
MEELWFLIPLGVLVFGSYWIVNNFANEKDQ